MRGRNVAADQVITVQPDQIVTETTVCVNLDHKILLKQKRGEKNAIKVLLSRCVSYKYHTLLFIYKRFHAVRKLQCWYSYGMIIMRGQRVVAWLDLS